MAVYAGPMPPGPGIVAKTVCFSGGTATGISAALVTLMAALGLFGGAVAGGLIGLIVSLITGPEILTKIAGFKIGAVVGAIIGTIGGIVYMRRQIKAGACTCPAGAQAFCLDFYFQIVPGLGPIPMPLPPGANGAACATIVPAGCP